MKKILFLLGCIVTLTACSSDSVFDEQSTDEELPMSTNSFNNDDSGYINGPGGTKAPGINDYSPWDIWFNRGPDFVDKQPAYIFWNGNVDGGGEPDIAYSPYTLEVHAWVGLAYFDGDDDGDFNDISPTKTGNPPLLVAPMGSSGNYPNLYANGHEVGNLVQMQPFIINPMTGSRLESADDHLPVDPGNVKYGANFDFPGGLTQQEMDLLREYGKVFFYEVYVYEAGAFIGQYIMHPEISTLPNYTPAAYWEPVIDPVGTHVQGDMPLLGSFDLYYINHPIEPWTKWDPDYGSGKSPKDNECDSHEVVFYLPPGMNLHSQAITGGSVPKTLNMGFTHHPFTLWQSSSLDLFTY